MVDNSRSSLLEVGVDRSIGMTEVEEAATIGIETTEDPEEILVIDHQEEISVTDPEDVSTAEKKDT